ncbi:MAG TPA: universal stress protein [Polyangiaceae bacterium]
MKHILVCLDSSERAPFVLVNAAELARLSGAKLSLFRAVGLPRELPASAYSMSPDSLVEKLLESAREELRVLADGLPAELQGKLEVRIGSPSDAICATAREQHADLVVIGAHGYGSLDRLLGTTAAKVVNHIDRPVLVVRSPPGRLERE